MMMCIGGVIDFEAQLTASVERFAVGSVEDLERRVRGGDYCYARFYMDKLHHDYWIEPLEPSRPYSHGRRFIPEWLAAERERSMPREMLWRTSAPLTIGYVFDDDYTVAVRWK